MGGSAAPGYGASGTSNARTCSKTDHHLELSPRSAMIFHGPGHSTRRTGNPHRMRPRRGLGRCPDDGGDAGNDELLIQRPAKRAGISAGFGRISGAASGGVVAARVARPPRRPAWPDFLSGTSGRARDFVSLRSVIFSGGKGHHIPRLAFLRHTRAGAVPFLPPDPPFPIHKPIDTPPPPLSLYRVRVPFAMR